eukprot:gene8061-biopygen15134
MARAGRAGGRAGGCCLGPAVAVTELRWARLLPGARHGRDRAPLGRGDVGWAPRQERDRERNSTTATPSLDVVRKHMGHHGKRVSRKLLPVVLPRLPGLLSTAQRAVRQRTAQRSLLRFRTPLRAQAGCTIHVAVIGWESVGIHQYCRAVGRQCRRAYTGVLSVDSTCLYCHVGRQWRRVYTFVLSNCSTVEHVRHDKTAVSQGGVLVPDLSFAKALAWRKEWVGHGWVWPGILRSHATHATHAGWGGGDPHLVQIPGVGPRAGPCPWDGPG